MSVAHTHTVRKMQTAQNSFEQLLACEASTLQYFRTVYSLCTRLSFDVGFSVLTVVSGALKYARYINCERLKCFVTLIVIH